MKAVKNFGNGDNHYKGKYTASGCVWLRAQGSLNRDFKGGILAMKKLFFFLCCLLALSATAFAEKSEWIDPGYDFTKAPEIADGVRDKDAQAVFFERAKADIVDKLIKAKYNVGLTDNAKGNAAGKEAANTKAVKTQSAENPRLASGDYDLVVRCTVSQYDTGKKHVEAHTETVMVPVTATVLDVTGHMQTITIQEQQVYNIPAGEYPAAFVKVRFDVINTKTNQNVWTWEDAREKVADPGISNVKPKEVLTGIMADFSASLRHNLKSRKPKGK